MLPFTNDMVSRSSIGAAYQPGLDTPAHRHVIRMGHPAFGITAVPACEDCVIAQLFDQCYQYIDAVKPAYQDAVATCNRCVYLGVACSFDNESVS